jgi:hypothetical protein
MISISALLPQVDHSKIPEERQTGQVRELLDNLFGAQVEDEGRSLSTLQKTRAARPYAAFKSAIDEALAKLAKPPNSG